MGPTFNESSSCLLRHCLVHVNYSFFKFLGIGLLHVATSLQVGLHWWQTACIPRSVQWLMYLVKRRNLMAEVT